MFRQRAGHAAPLVTVVKATAQDVPEYLDEIGRNAAFESVTVTPQVGGRIVERHFQDGENLKKGQLLFVIDPRPYKAQLDSAQASARPGKSGARSGEDSVRARRRSDRRATPSRSRTTTRRRTLLTWIRRRWRPPRRALETAKLNLEYCYIHSPIERPGGRAPGGCGERGAGEYDIACFRSSGSIRSMRISRSPRATSRQCRSRCRAGMLKAAVRLPSDPEDAARTGRVEFLDNSVQNGSGTVNLRATLSNADHHFWPGQFVDVKLVLEHRERSGADSESSRADQPERPVRLCRESRTTRRNCGR